MSLEDRNLFAREFLEKKCLPILSAKGEDYSGHAYANSNFDRIADRVGLDRYEVWLVFFHKHLDAITTYLRTGRLSAEPIDDRIADAINYLLILASMLREDENARSASLEV